ncbi:MAG: hypothetical protein ACRYHC_09795 [Janthinobacterium lividum]
MIDLERATKLVENVHTIIQSLDSVSSVVDRPAQSLHGSQKQAISFAPVALVASVRDAISAILIVLETASSPIKGGHPGPPPKWWGDVQNVVASEGLKGPDAEQALIHAFDVLKSHVSVDCQKVAGLIFLQLNLERKIIRSPRSIGSVAITDPHTNRAEFVFEPKVNTEANDPLHELESKVSMFPDACVRYLRGALNEIRNLE